MAKGKRANQPPRTPGSEVIPPGNGERRDIVVEHTALWSGPMPPPDIVRGYNDAVENGGERVFQQFEVEADHRRRMNWRGQTFAFIIAISGRVCALIFSIAFLGVAVYALKINQPWVAGAGLSGSLALVVGAFTGIPSLLKRLTEAKKPPEK